MRKEGTTDLEIRRRRTQRGKRKGREVRDPMSSELFSTEFTLISFKTYFFSRNGSFSPPIRRLKLNCRLGRCA